MLNRIATLFSGLRSRGSLFVAALAVFAMTVAAPAFAVDTPPDYAAMVTGAKTELSGGLTAAAPIVFGILGILAAVGFAWKMFKKAAKSS